MPDFDPPMIEGGRGVLLPLPPVVIDRLRRVGICQIELGTRYSPERALAAVASVRTID